MGNGSSLLGAFESHDAVAIRRALNAGDSPTAPIKGKTPLVSLMEMYTRSAHFADCLRMLLNAGASFDDPLLESLLLDDADALRRVLKRDSRAVGRTFHLACTYVSLDGASPLHVCAEYNSVQCARALLGAGHPVDARAETDDDGFGGQTPLFHTVNSNRNYCRPMMELLADAGASLDVHLKGLVWGKTFEWETTVLDVTPLSFAQCGLFPQFHRSETDVYSNLSYLYAERHGGVLPVRNVPNAYLRH